MDQHTQSMIDEIYRLRNRVIKADQIESKLDRIQKLLPPILHVGAPLPKDRKAKKPLDLLLDDVVRVLNDAKLKGNSNQRRLYYTFQNLLSLGQLQWPIWMIWTNSHT